MKFIKNILFMLPLLLSSGSFFFAQTQTEFIVYDESNSPLPNNTIRCLLVDRENVLWVGTDHGLAKFDNGVWEIFKFMFWFIVI